MGFFNKITGGEQGSNTTTITEIDCIKFDALFCKTFTKSLYSKIIHECADRAMIPENIDKPAYTMTVYDSFSPRKAGVVSLIVDALIDCKQVFYRKRRLTTGVYIFDRVSTTDALDDDGNLSSPDIIELDFRTFSEAKIVSLLFQLLGEVLQTMSKGVTVSGALLFKIHALSEMIANSQNLKPFEEQIKQISEGLSSGKPSYIDAQSDLVFPSYDSKPAEESTAFIFSLISNITGMPNSFLFGEVVGGLGDSSGGDEKRMNAAMKKYFYSIYSGVVHAVFDRNFEYKMVVDDIAALISAFAFVETTTLLTEKGKLKFMLNNTAFEAADINIDNKNG